MKILITSGGTKVPIDSVRHIGNFSTGRYGSELADSLIPSLWKERLKTDHDGELIFFHEKGSKLPIGINSPNSVRIEYKDYFEYLHVKDIIKNEQPDIIISAAAVSDYIVKDSVTGKISSDNEDLTITLTKAEKVISKFRELAPNSIIYGFKLLVSPSEDEVITAVKKVLKNGADYVVYNDLNELKSGNSTRTIFDRDLNKTYIYNTEVFKNFIYENSNRVNG
jgi:phosphopantothenoylcysteine synthetase/decarboxylase